MCRLAAILIVCLVPPAAAAQSGWEAVTSKEGGFSVEMPAKPALSKSSTRKSGGSTTRVILVACETDGGVYLVQKVELPAAVLKGAEDAQLDAERDEFAAEWRGKVLSEKKVRAGGRPGRDFTVRGKPEKGSGELTVRVREYLDGRAVYLIAVVSQPNRELPVDAGRFLGSLAIGEAKARVAGSPEKEIAGTPLEGFGAAIDPAGDCKFVPKGKGLTIQVPGTFHDLNPDTTTLNAPRALVPVEGDFTLTVKVGGEFKAGGKTTNPNPKGAPYNGAGILIWSDSDNFIRLERGSFARGGKVFNTVAFEEREGGYRGAVHNEPGRPGDCYLRIERKGSRISGSVSYDGTKWSKLKPIDTVWPAKLRAGLVAINTSSEPFAPAFEDFTLETKGR